MVLLTYISCMNCKIPVAVKEGIPYTFTKTCWKCGKKCGYVRANRKPVKGEELEE